jgi:hypothetical protein
VENGGGSLEAALRSADASRSPSPSGRRREAPWRIQHTHTHTHELTAVLARTHHPNTAVAALLLLLLLYPAAASPSLTFRPRLLLPCADPSTTNTIAHASNIRFSTLAPPTLHPYPHASPAFFSFGTTLHRSTARLTYSRIHLRPAHQLLYRRPLLPAFNLHCPMRSAR